MIISSPLLVSVGASLARRRRRRIGSFPVRTRGSSPTPRIRTSTSGATSATCAANSSGAPGEYDIRRYKRLQRSPVDRDRDARPQPPDRFSCARRIEMPRRQAPAPARNRYERDVEPVRDRAHPVEEIGVAREVDGARAGDDEAERRQHRRQRVPRRAVLGVCRAHAHTAELELRSLHHFDDGTDVCAPHQTARRRTERPRARQAAPAGGATARRDGRSGRARRARGRAAAATTSTPLSARARCPDAAGAAPDP